MKSSRQQPQKKQAGCPAWMMTFGDCMSLLVCFFVMLIAFSNMQAEKLSAMIGAMSGALGGIAPIGKLEVSEHKIQADGLTKVDGDAEKIRFLTLEEMSEMVPQMIAEIRASNQSEPDNWPDRVLIRMLEDGLTIILQTESLFIDGTADWANADDNALWNGLAKLLSGHDNPMLVTAILSRQTTVLSETWRSVWGLGVERAEAVAHVLQTAMQAEPTRFGTGVQIAHHQQDEALQNSVLITILGRNPIMDLRTGTTNHSIGEWQ